MAFAIDFKGQYGTRYKVYRVSPGGTIQEEITDQDFPHDKQIEYFDSQSPYVLFGGGRGGGKTEAIVWDCIFTAYLVPGKAQIILRRTMGELDRTIIKRFRELPAGLVGTYHGSQSSEHMSFPNGSTIYFASAKDEKEVRKYLSGEFIKATFDEWGEWPLSMWKFIAGSVRSTTEYDILHRPVVSQVKGATNPGGIGGDALNHLFGCEVPKGVPKGEDPETYDPAEYEFIKSMVDDNPAYASDRPAGIAYRKMLKSQPRRVRDAWLYGKWSGFEGQYFEGLEEDKTRIPHDLVLRMMKRQFWQPVFIGIDWGKTHHSYVSWNTFLEFALRDGKVVKLPVSYRELLVKGIGEGALAEEIVDYTPAEERQRIQQIFLSPDCFGDSLLSRARRIGDIFATYDLPRPVEAYNPRVDGWDMMHELLRDEYEVNPESPWHPTAMIYDEADNPIDEKVACSGWLISDQCTSAWEALPWAMSDPKKDGDIVKDGDSALLDVLDGLRYSIVSHIHPENKPFSERIKDELITLPVEGSSRYIHWLQSKKQEREEYAPAYMPVNRRKRR